MKTTINFHFDLQKCFSKNPYNQPEQEDILGEIREYEIWVGCYLATGEHGSAELRGREWGRSFKEACIKHFKDDPYFNKKTMDYWCLGLFNNEKDAKKRCPYCCEAPPGYKRPFLP